MIKINHSAIPMAVKAAEVASKYVSIYKYEPNSPAAKAYAELSKEVLQMAERKSDSILPTLDDLFSIQESQILPSEKAFAYKMRLGAMKRQGQRTDLIDRKSTRLNSSHP